MFLNAAKSYSSLTEDNTDSQEFDLLPAHIGEANKLDKKIENRVRNVFLLGFASVLKDLSEAVSIFEVYNDDTFIRRMTLKCLKENEELKSKTIDRKKWTRLKDDLSWFVIFNEKLKTSKPYHFQTSRKREKIMEANGIYYRKVLLKKKVKLQLVKWFKKRMGIKVKLSGGKVKNELHVQKYKLMKPLIVKRLLKDIIACGFFSCMRERLIEVLYDRRRKQLIRMKNAEKKFRNTVKYFQQKLVQANKFSIARRKIREKLIKLKILRIKSHVKKKVFNHLKRLGFSTTREVEEFQSTAIKRLRHLKKAGVSSPEHLVHFKSLNSDTFIKNLVKDLIKRGKLDGRAPTVLEFFNANKIGKKKSGGHSMLFRSSYFKSRSMEPQIVEKPTAKNVISLLKTRMNERIQKSSQPARKSNRSSIKIEMSRPKRLKKNVMHSRRREKKKMKSFRKANKIHKSITKAKTNFRKLMKKPKHIQINVRSPNSTLPSRKVHRKKRKLREEHRRTIAIYKGIRRKYPSILKENKLKTCTEKLIKSAPHKMASDTIKVMDRSHGEKLKRRLHQEKNIGRSVIPGQSSDQLSTKSYTGLIDSLKSMVTHKSSIGSASNQTPTTMSDVEKESISEFDMISGDYSSSEGQSYTTKKVNFSRKRLASERIEAEKRRLEETVLRSVETRFKELMMEVPKDKDLRITDKLGGYLARHAWRRFYTGKSSHCERVPFQQNSKNKPPPWGSYRLYKPLVYNRHIKYYLVVHGFDLTPRKFNSKMYPYCPVSYDALWFFSSILRDSKFRRDRLKYKNDFSRNESAFSQSSAHHRFTVDYKSTIDISLLPHLMFREEDVISQEPEEDDVPPMFTLRRELKSSEPEDRQDLRFRILLVETETIELITIESRLNFNLIEKETSIGISEFSNVEKKLSKYDIFTHAKKKKRKTVLSIGSTTKVKEERDTLHTITEVSVSSKPEKSLIEFDSRTFKSRGVQVVQKSLRSTKVQVNAPTRKNTSTQVTFFDFSAEANKEKATDTLKSIYLKLSETEGSSSSDDFEGEDMDDPLLVTKSIEFRETLTYVQRILSSNIYKKSQLFYTRYHVDPLSGKLPISYECVHLWTFHDYRIQLSQMTVNSIAPHPFDCNIIAVAYAKNELATRDLGLVCIWNIKNIFFPEQVIKFSSSINYIEFSHPTTISVALMGGFVAVINITKKKHKITMNTERTTTTGFLPIWQFSWFLEENGEKFPVSCGADGRMIRYRSDETFAATVIFEATPIENELRGVKGEDNSFRTAKWKEKPEMTACAQHPTDLQSYLVGTSEGTIHVCSLLLRNHLEVFSAQEGRINAIKFHPHCEHVFLTVGGDFCVRIWAIGIFEPLLTYTARNEYIEDACFNEIWPELMISISGEYVDIWNIRRRVCIPVQSWSNPKQLKNTCIEFSTDGYSVIVGDIGGYVHSFRLCEMPCESKMKAEVLSQAIISNLSVRQDLIAALSKLGYPFSVTYIEHFLKSGSSRKNEVL